MSGELFEAYITGIGESAVGRSLFRSPLDLALEAICAAIADAGLTRADIDGLVGYTTDNGFTLQIQEALDLRLNWFAQCDNGPSQVSAVFEACSAVQTGRARHVLAFHASDEGSNRVRLGRGGSLPGTTLGMPTRMGGFTQWSAAFGAISMGHNIAMFAQRHMHVYGTTRDQLAQIALVERTNAGRNPDAVYRDPLTMDDYFAARMIMDPFCLFDCDVPIDFGSAVIISRSDTVADARRVPLRVAAIGTALHSRASLDQFDDLATMPMRDSGADLWTRTDYSPSDVDVAYVYDGFSFMAMTWIEALGFCGPGESGPFIEGGKRISLDGELPLNTSGGQLSAGRKHGWGSISEASTQLWGEAGARQVPGEPKVATLGLAGGIFAGSMVIARE